MKHSDKFNIKPERRVQRSNREKNRFNRVLFCLTAFLLLTTVLLACGQLISEAWTKGSGLETESSNRSVQDRLVIEAGSPLPEADRFCLFDSLTGVYVSPIEEVDPSLPGEYPLQIQVQNQIYDVTLVIVDTTPPTGMVQNQEINLGESITADAFVSQVYDAAPVQIAFKQSPDLTKPGQQDVIILLSDTSDNQTELTAVLTILEDTEPPVIRGAADLYVYLGNSISYREGVTVTDNHDADVQLEIDNSAVNPRVPGTYPVVYRATDAAGNSAEVTITLTLAERPDDYVTEEQLYVLIDDILAEITNPQMSDLEKLSAIFYFIADHIDYTGTSEKTDWVMGAYLGITTGTGDCFNYFATAKAFLTRAGFETIPIERVKDANTRHYWNLVKYNGAWYHFDPLPYLAKYHFVCLLRTDDEVAAYSKENPRFYEFNRDGIPETPKEPLNIERKIIYG